MFKIYRRTIRIKDSEGARRLEYRVGEPTGTLAKILAIPLLFGTAVVATLVFSLFFVVLLMPLGLVAFNVWRRMKELRQVADQEIIDAEYTVVSEQDKSEGRG